MAIIRSVLTVLWLITAASAVATGDDGDSHESGHHGEFHPNTIGGFIGITGEDRRERALTLGIEYERRFTERFGLTLSAERVLGDLDFTVVTVPLAIHVEEWIFSVGPGYEMPDEGSDHHLVRVGASRVFTVGNTEYVPKINLDFIDGDVVIVGGLFVGLGF